jgi:hypothetical protein
VIDTSQTACSRVDGRPNSRAKPDGSWPYHLFNSRVVSKAVSDETVLVTGSPRSSLVRLGSAIDTPYGDCRHTTIGNCKSVPMRDADRD